MFKLPHNCIIPHANKVMLKILQASFQQYVNHELTDVQAGFQKGRGTRDKIYSICLIIKKARKFQKNIYFYLLATPKPFTLWITTNSGKFLEMGITDHLTCTLRNLYTGQEAALRTGHRTTNWFQIWKGVHQGCILLPRLLNLYPECIVQNEGLDET